MALTIQGIRSFLANQNINPRSQNSGDTPLTPQAGQVQDTVSFSAESTARADLELMRARFAASAATLPARQDSAVLEANRNTLSLFRDTTATLQPAEEEPADNNPIPADFPQVEKKQPAEVVGVLVTPTPTRTVETTPAQTATLGAIGAGTVDRTNPAAPQQQLTPTENRPLFAEEATPARVFTAQAPRQPDTALPNRFRDRNDTANNPPPLRQRTREEAPTVATQRNTNADATANPTGAPGIPAPAERGLPLPRGLEENPTTAQPGALGNQAAPNRGGVDQNVRGNGTDLGVNDNRENNPLGVRGFRRRNLADEARNALTAGLPGTNMPATPQNTRVENNPVAGNTSQNVETPITRAQQQAEEQLQAEEDNAPFAVRNGFRGRPGQPNPTTLPRPATLEFARPRTEGTENNTNGPANETNGQAANTRNQPEQTNPNPTVVPINRNAALSLYARLGGFGRQADVSQGDETTRLSRVA